MNNGYELLSPGHSETKRNTDQQTCQWGLDFDQSLNQRSLETKVYVWDQVEYSALPNNRAGNLIIFKEKTPTQPN